MSKLHLEQAMTTPEALVPLFVRMESVDELQEYILKDVQRNGRQLGSGAYGSVEELEVNGVVVAGKKIHDVLVDPFNQGADAIRAQFVAECKIMSSLRHPHIVQFLGICFQEGTTLPVLVMEYLPQSLDALLEHRLNVPIAMKVAFLNDVAKGLAYLHSHEPPIIHRDLTARNVLLNSAMVAKITDFGVARIVNVHGNQAASLTRAPGAVVYMPPEADQSTASYNTKLDIFSYGVVMLFTITQVFPKDLEPATYMDRGTQALLARSEVDRRARYFEMADRLIGDQTNPAHKLIELAEKCLHNDPAKRPTVTLLLTMLPDLHRQLPDEILGKDKLDLVALVREAREEVLVKEEALQQQRQELEVHREQLASLKEELEAAVRENKETMELLQGQQQLQQGSVVSGDTQSSGILQQQLERTGAELEETRLREENLKVAIASHEERYEEVSNELRLKVVQIQTLEAEMERRGKDVAARDAEIQRLQAVQEQLSLRNAELVVIKAELSETEAREGALRVELSEREEREGALQGELAEIRTKLEAVRMTRQLIRGPPQPSGLSVKLHVRWKICPSAPIGMNNAQCIFFQSENKLVVGGGSGAMGDNGKRILEYNIGLQTWREFPMYMFSMFAIAVLENQLLLVGGFNDMKDEYSNRVSVWTKDGSYWKNWTAMPTPRCEVAAVGYKRWLVVAGGFERSGSLDVVEVLDKSTSQWSVADSLPEPCVGLRSTVVIEPSGRGNDVWYLLGEGGIKNHRPAFAASLPLLTSQTGSGIIAWKILPQPPLKSSGAVAVRGFLLAVGGKDGHSQRQDVHIYLPGTCEWLHVADLPSARHSCACASLLDSKFVVYGGREKKDFSADFIQASAM